MRPRISIPSEVERLSYHRCNVGIRISIFRWWQYAGGIQRSTSTLKVLINTKRNQNVLSVSLSLASIQNVSGIVRRWLEKLNSMCLRPPKWMHLPWAVLRYALPTIQHNVLDYLSEDCIRQVNNIRHKLLDMYKAIALLCGNELSTLLWLQ